MAFDNSGTKAVGSSWAQTTPKGCELPLFYTALGRAVRRWEALNLGSLNVQFHQDWPKDKKLQLF